eukprot:364173-Chlamydomonas_euryale.AAC.5
MKHEGVNFKRDSNSTHLEYSAHSAWQPADAQNILRLVLAHAYELAGLSWAFCGALQCKWLMRSCWHFPCEPFPQQQQRSTGQCQLWQPRR